MEQNPEEERAFLYLRGLWSAHRALMTEGLVSGMTTRDVGLSVVRGRRLC